MINILEKERSLRTAVEKIKKGDTGRLQQQNESLIAKSFGHSSLQFILKNVPNLNQQMVILDTSSMFNIEKEEENSVGIFCNAQRINNFRRINKYLESVNSKLTLGGLYIGKIQPKDSRKRAIYSKYKGLKGKILYFLDFCFHRIAPKVWGTRKVYFLLTKGKYRVMSKAEGLGRVVSCGFDLIDYKEINGGIIFIAKKARTPHFDMSPSFGPLFKMKRIGKNGKTIGVYKLRTMHPYSEYLQAHIYESNQLAEGGKFKDDFRITTSGKIMRKFWLDELPMFLNILKGDMKLVGVRPLSKHYLSLYPDNITNLRKKVKPGLLPPFYYDMPKTLDEIIESEEKYITSYLKSPITTDVKYAFTIVYNILIKKVRSA